MGQDRSVWWILRKPMSIILVFRLIWWCTVIRITHPSEALHEVGIAAFMQRLHELPQLGEARAQSLHGGPLPPQRCLQCVPLQSQRARQHAILDYCTWRIMNSKSINIMILVQKTKKHPLIFNNKLQCLVYQQFSFIHAYYHARILNGVGWSRQIVTFTFRGHF